MAASATFALKVGVWFRRARLLIVSPDSRVNLARRQAETPLIPLFRFLRPALLKRKKHSHISACDSLHTGEVVGSIPTAPTIDINILDFVSSYRAHVSPAKRIRE